MDERRNIISSAQFMNFIVSTQIGIGLLGITGNLAKAAGHDGWISVIIGGSITLAVSIIIVLLLKRYGSKSIYEINRFLYGKYLGNGLNFILVGYFIYCTAIGGRIFTEMVKIMELRLTPPLILVSFIIIPTIYLTWYGLKPICRLSGLIYINILVTFFFFLLISKHLRLTFLMPVGEAGLSSILKGTISIMFSFYGHELTTVIYPDITDKKNIMKYFIGAITVTTIFYMIVVVVVTGFYGENMTVKELFSIIALSRAYRAPVFERIDVYMLMLWFPAMIISTQAYFYIGFYSIEKLFNIQRRVLLLCIYALSAALLSRLPKDMADVYRHSQIINMAGIPVAVVFPIICYLFSFINKKGIQIE